MDTHKSVYRVEKVETDFSITGTGNSQHWKNSTALTDFSFPWENGYLPHLSFKALQTPDWLYCLFEVTDTKVIVFVDKHDKKEVMNSDRVELFLRCNEKMAPYYCLELDPLGRTLDYKAEHYRIFDMDWSWPANELKVKAHQTQSGYSVEVAISKKSLIELGVLQNNRLEAGLFRGKCMEINEGVAKLKWISWIKPDSPSPDFHIPSSFGVLML